MPGAPRLLRLAIPGALVLAIATLSACDAKVRRIRSSLSDQEIVLFDRGRQVASPCWACHDFYGTQNKVGPYLSGLYGRRAGSVRFGGYSDALRYTAAVWDDRTLDAFLADPQRFAPGTTMVSPGVRDPADREALIFYIKQVTR
jgi:cytochrome c